MAQVAVVVASALSRRDRDRLGIDFMRGRGHKVTVLDAADMVHPAVQHDRRHYADSDIDIRVESERSKLSDHLPMLRRSDIVFNFAESGLCTKGNLPVLRLISQSGKPYLTQYTNAFPGFMRYRGEPAARRRRVADVISRLGDIDPANSAISRLPPRLLGVDAPRFHVVGGMKSAAHGRLADDGTTRVFAHAMDFELYRNEAAKRPPQTETAVFLDEYLPYHPDLAAMGLESPMEAGAYFACLRRLFDRIETELGLEVVIAANPRADYSDKPGVFGERRIVRYQTAPLVAQSRLVVAHRSTAVNFAVLFRKPLLITAMRETYRHVSQRPYFDGLSEALAQPIQYFDDPGDVDLETALTVNDRAYDGYIDDYIKRIGSPDLPFWQIVADAIEAETGLKL